MIEEQQLITPTVRGSRKDMVNFNNRSYDERCRPEELVDGKILFERIHDGFGVHASDAVERQDGRSAFTEIPGLSIMVFLRGDVKADLGTQFVHYGHSLRPDGKEGPYANILAKTQKTKFARYFKKGVHVRKVIVGLSTDWLNDYLREDTPETRAIETFRQTHLNLMEWVPTPRMVNLAEDILLFSEQRSLMEKLFLEQRSIELVSEAFRMLNEDRKPVNDPLNERERKILKLSLDYIHSHFYETLSIGALSRDVGMAASQIQRLFKQAFGKTVFEYIRTERLSLAHDGLRNKGIAIAEAAYVAGYSNTANFSTAFKRQFGKTPKQARRNF
ncbi:helix-turn-helix domain-containing protein [Sneathiella sp.]|uniref:helix-turn-helix domain-containing protein n=1 Tax=Sneathiella sp. TaxID=1964365 RepID=UPI002607DE1B|nr:AraC family transcriptional regulator [Sneathiella sp.]MDF2368039.1 AraC family transcriptional regulator [Sneathiella sp.]